jgi:hypothetical protein
VAVPTVLDVANPSGFPCRYGPSRCPLPLPVTSGGGNSTAPADTILLVVPTNPLQRERPMKTDLPEDTGSLQERFVQEFLPWLKRRTHYLRRAQYREDQIEELLGEATALAWAAWIRCPGARRFPGKLARFSVLQALGGRRLCQAGRTSLESGHRSKRPPEARARYADRSEAMELPLDLFEAQISYSDDPADTAVAKLTLEGWLQAQSPDRQAVVHDLVTLGAKGTAQKRGVRQDTVRSIKKRALADYLVATS